MITRLIATVLVAAGLAAVPSAPATAGGATVSVADMRFTPARLTVALGGTVTWTFTDQRVHTTTSTQGFWASGSRSDGETFARAFRTAGRYPYRCTIHPSMRGTVKVPVATTRSEVRGWRLRWGPGRPAGATYDVQVRRGSRAWKPLRTDTSSPGAVFTRKGTWSVRARTTQGSATSGWSPPVVVKTP